jgi:hypothetical protein
MGLRHVDDNFGYEVDRNIEPVFRLEPALRGEIVRYNHPAYKYSELEFGSFI